MSRTMRFDWLRILALSLLCMSTTGVQAQASAQSASSQLPEDYPEKILFVGNSFTYYNDGLHMHYGNLLRAANLYDEGRNALRMMTYSGSGLWEHPAALRSAVTNDDWDVVMHDYGNGPLTQWQRFVASSDKLSEIARGQGARPLLLMTWAYADQPEMTIQLAEAYTRQGKELAATVIPVGLAFAAASKTLAINLCIRQTYCGLRGASRFTKKSSSTQVWPALTWPRVPYFQRSQALVLKGLIYTGGLDAEVARVLQRVAHTTVQSYQRNP